MRQNVVGRHTSDPSGNPAGGSSIGVGIEIHWQDGPLGRGADRQEPNGAFVEGVLAAALDRLNFYQDSRFKCPENAFAIMKIEEALHWLDHRTQARESAGVEGTHKV